MTFALRNKTCPPRLRAVLPLAAAVFIAISVPSAAVTGVAACATCSPTFAEALRASSVVTVSFVLEAAADGSATLRTERVLKGSAPPLQTYSPDDKAVHLTAGATIVLMGGQETLDFRGVWVLTVNGDGTLDSAGLRGAPRTLAELEAFVALPETATVQFGRASAVPSLGGQLIVTGAALLLIAGVWIRRIGATSHAR
jgi:hypothetical protein